MALVTGVIEAPQRGWTSAEVLACAGVALAAGSAFARWELRVAEPLLDLLLLREPRFGITSLGVALASFALFGAIFATTQVLQDALGYSALEAGAAMVPVAVGLVAGAGSSLRLAGRFGTPVVMTAGLVGLAAVLVSSLAWTAGMDYAPLGVFSSCPRCSWDGSWARRRARSWARSPRRGPGSPPR